MPRPDLVAKRVELTRILAEERAIREDRPIRIVGIIDECRMYPPERLEMGNLELYIRRHLADSSAVRKVVYDDKGRVSHLVDVK